MCAKIATDLPSLDHTGMPRIKALVLNKTLLAPQALLGLSPGPKQEAPSISSEGCLPLTDTTGWQ